jgi:WD40 repeat protein
MIHAWASRAGLDSDESADLVQEVFLILVDSSSQNNNDRSQIMHFKRLASLTWFPLAIVCLAVAGCGGGHKDFTPETFATVKPGMAEAQVIEVLGKPHDTVDAQGVRRLFWETKDKYYSISFEQGKLVAPLAHADKTDYVMMRELMRAASSLKPEPAKGPSEPLALSPDVPKVQPKVKFKLPGERDDLACLSQDGKRLAVAYMTKDYKHFTQIWDLSAQPKVLAEFKDSVFALSPSGKRLLGSGSMFDSTVYDVDTKKPLAQLPISFSHGFFRDEHKVAVTGRSYSFETPAKGQITQWDIEKNADAGSFEVPDKRFSVALPAKNGKEFWLFMAKDKFEVECYDLDAKKLARTVKPEPEEPNKPYHDSGIYSAITWDSSVFSSCTQKTHIFDAESGKIVGGLPPDLWDCASGFLPGGTRRFSLPGGDKAKPAGFGGSEVIIYDWKNRKAVAALVGHAAGEESPIAAVSGDGKTAVTISKKGEALVFDITPWAVAVNLPPKGTKSDATTSVAPTSAPPTPAPVAKVQSPPVSKPDAAAAAEPKQPAAPHFRTWIDATGKFRIEAQCLGVADGKVELKKKDGSSISIPLAKLSRADKAYVLLTAEQRKSISLKALASPTRAEFVETPLKDVLEYFRDLHLVEILVDESAADLVANADKSSITLSARDISLDRGLRVVLEQVGLVHILCEGNILVATKDAARKYIGQGAVDPGPLIAKLPPDGKKAGAASSAPAARPAAPPVTAKAEAPPEPNAVAELKKRGVDVKLNDQGKAVAVSFGQDNGSDDSVALLGGMKSLEEIDFYGDFRGAWKVTDKGIAQLKALTDLKRLILTGTRVTDAGMASLESLKNLEVLHLGSCSGVSDAGMAHIAGLTNLQEIVTAPSFGNEGMKQLKGLTKLRKLNLIGNSAITDAGMSALEGKPDLEELNIWDAKVTDAGLAYLRASTRLTKLDLVGTSITDAGLIHLNEMADLEKLDLSKTGVNGSGFAKTAGLKKLSDLHMARTAVTDESIFQLKSLSGLLFVDVSRTKVTDKGVEALKKLLPNCNVMK